MLIILTIVTVLFLDQLSKFLVNQNLALHQSIPVVDNIFHITLVYNRGAAFGIFKSQTSLFIFTSLFAIVLILLELKKNSNNRYNFYNFSLALILAGALGNLIDRFFLGYVIDFLDFRIWPVFNLADSAITVGAIGLGYILLRPRYKIKS